ncbi:MAG: spermidine/putrescine ABC transporter substrate-binding protein [Deltaproteobacteria bacterium]|jgi:spermidine/putrescine transport system substrate-binding protein|nr:spermidine/putrescine ABC transporter substrate-binding protein [Deltaproteobacteria bacterium]
MVRLTSLFSLILSVFCLSLFLVPTQSYAEQKNLTIFIWSEYIDLDIIAEFEKLYDVKVKLDFFESNEEMIGKLQTVRQGIYDIIVPSTYFIPTLTNLDLIQPLNHALLPNLKNLFPAFREVDVDPGNVYTVPYQWGTSGLAVKAEDPATIKPTWSLLFDETQSLGSFYLFDTARDALGSALKFLGYSLNSEDAKAIEEAGNLLIKTKQRPDFRGFDSGVGGLSKVMGGVATVAQVYSGEALKAKVDLPDVHYIIPQEGCEIWLDLLAIPKNSPNVETAHLFINYILDPKVSARVTSFNNYATPNQAAMEFIPDSEKNNPQMYPDLTTMNNLEFMRDLGENNRIYEDTWTLVKTR